MQWGWWREKQFPKERAAHSGSAKSNQESVVICLSDKGSVGG